jgi:predicted TIM-barrel fold metal-dependent hydrolase
MLLFATDYPHWDFDNPLYVPFDHEWAEQVFDTNAREWYRLPALAKGIAEPTRAQA